MTEEKIKEIVAETVRELTQHSECANEQHRQEHEFIRELIDTFHQMNVIKWTVFKAVAVAATFAALALMGLKLKG